jgi:hypothetical protein
VGAPSEPRYSFGGGADYVARGPSSLDAFRLTSDAGVFSRAREARPLVGRVDRAMFAEGGLYLVSDAVIDATRRTVRRFSAGVAGPIRLDLPPVALSPDERSFVRVGFDHASPETPVLHVTDTVAGQSYAVPIDEARTRLASIEAIDPAWVAHYFEWQRGPDGIDRLAARANVTPLPYRGTLTTDHDEYREYRLHQAGQPVAEALVEFLKSGFNAEVSDRGESASWYEARIADRVVNVTVQANAGVVSVWMERGTDTALVADIAARFDVELATGRYDQTFGR